MTKKKTTVICTGGKVVPTKDKLEKAEPLVSDYNDPNYGLNLKEDGNNYLWLLKLIVREGMNLDNIKLGITNITLDKLSWFSSIIRNCNKVIDFITLSGSKMVEDKDERENLFKQLDALMKKMRIKQDIFTSYIKYSKTR